MINFLVVLALGFFLGTRHATDPDHVIAISTIVTRERNLYKSAVIGILWGIGHTLTILIVGGAIILFGLVIPPRVGLTMEFSVGLMLVLLGIFNLIAFWESLRHIASDRGRVAANHLGSLVPRVDARFQRQAHDLPEQSGNEDNPPRGRFHKLLGWLQSSHALRPLVVGVVHGLAGSAAIALFILATIRNPVWAMAYLVIFGIGTIAGMALITTAIAIPSVYGAKRFARVHRYFVVSTSLVSVGFGLLLAYRASLIGGLLSKASLVAPK